MSASSGPGLALWALTPYTRWSTEKVSQWLCSLNPVLEPYTEAIRGLGVDGSMIDLLAQQPDMLTSDIGMSKLHSAKVLKGIETLQLNLAMTALSAPPEPRVPVPSKTMSSPSTSFGFSSSSPSFSSSSCSSSSLSPSSLHNEVFTARLLYIPERETHAARIVFRHPISRKLLELRMKTWGASWLRVEGEYNSLDFAAQQAYGATAEADPDAELPTVLANVAGFTLLNTNLINLSLVEIADGELALSIRKTLRCNFTHFLPANGSDGIFCASDCVFRDVL